MGIRVGIPRCDYVKCCLAQTVIISNQKSPLRNRTSCLHLAVFGFACVDLESTPWWTLVRRLCTF